MYSYLTCMSVPTSPIPTSTNMDFHQYSPTNIDATATIHKVKSIKSNYSEVACTLTFSETSPSDFCDEIVDAISNCVATQMWDDHRDLSAAATPVKDSTEAVFNQEIVDAISNCVTTWMSEDSSTLSRTLSTSSTDSGFCSDGPATKQPYISHHRKSSTSKRDLFVCSSKSRHNSAKSASRKSNSDMNTGTTYKLLAIL